MPTPPALLLLLSSALAEELESRPDVLVATVPLSALSPQPDAPPTPPVAFSPTALRVALRPGAETRIELELDLDVHSSGPVSLPILGAAVAISLATLDNQPVALPPDPDGWRRLVGTLAEGRHRLRVEGTVLTPRPELDLPLLASPRTALTVAGDWEVDLPGAQRDARGRWDLTPRLALELTWKEPAPPSPRPQVVQARLAAALRVDTTGVQGRARVQTTVLHAPATTIDLRLPAVSELQVIGPAVAGWEQRGDIVRVSLVEPMEGRIDLDLSWRAASPGSAGAPVSFPIPQTSSGQLESGTLSLLSGDQGNVIPQAGRGLDPISASALPTWGRGLIDGAPVATLALTSASPDLVLRVLDLSPVDAPPTFVDEARIDVAYAAHGRALLRCRYQVRNDRNQYLVLTLPPGARPLGVRVAGTVVQPVSDGDRLLIPLEKSVETLTGLVSFPVEVALLSPDAPWEERGQRQLLAPGVDAPVSRATWEIILPPGASSRRIEGRPTLVDARGEEGEGPVIGRAVATGSTSLSQEDAAENTRERSQEAWNQAYRAYQDNEFEVARGMLEQSLAWDADNQAAQELMGNVDLLVGEDAARDDEQARRVRSMARAKTSGVLTVQTEKKQKATDAIRAGDYEAAKEALIELEEITRELVAVEDVEVVDQKTILEETRQELKALGYLDGVAEAAPGDEPAPEPRPAPMLMRLTDEPIVLTEEDGETLDELPLDAGEIAIVVEDAAQSVTTTVVGRSYSSLMALAGASGAKEDRRTKDRSAGRASAPTTTSGFVSQEEAVVASQPLPTPDSAGPPPPPPPPPPASTALPTALQMDPGVTAAPLSVRPPRAGQRLLLEQNLLAPGEQLTLDLHYRLRD